MAISLPIGGTFAAKCSYIDATGAPTAAPANAPALTWTVSDPTVATLDTDTGDHVTLTAVGAVGATAGLTVTDGTFTSAVDEITITAGPAAGLEILPAT